MTGRRGEGLAMSAAEALPPVNPWRDTSHIRDHIPTRAELAACPPADPAKLARHHANVATLVTQAAWQIQPAEEDDFLDALYQAHVDQAFIEHNEHARDWPQNEKAGWE